MLFGLDLRNLWGWITLAANQLLFDPTSWFARRLQPPMLLLHGDDWFRCHARHLEKADPAEDMSGSSFFGVSIPEDSVLWKEIKLPLSSEIFLPDAVALEVDGASPFPAEELVYGYSIVSREDSALVALIAMTTHQAAAAAQARWRDARPAGGDSSEAQVCVVFDGQHLVEFEQYRDPARNLAYRAVLNRFVSRFFTVMITAATALAVVAGSSSFRASRLADNYAELRESAVGVDQAVETLHWQHAVLSAVGAEVETRLDYAFWLNHIAKSTPDDTRLQRLLIDQSNVQVLGYSDNAANYLRSLTEEPAYSGVSARSAFVRDSRSGKERFQIDWSLMQEAN